MSLRNRLALAAAGLITLAAVDRLAAATEVPAGVWVWDTGEAAVEFHRCGPALCGRIRWLKAESAPAAEVLRDGRNPDPGLRARRVCGIDYITGLKQTATGDWRKGRVYDFHSGKTYDLDIDAVDASRVQMRGYQGMRLLGATLTLVRPPGAALSCKAAD